MIHCGWLGFLILVLAAVIVWPLRAREIPFDPHAEPFGDQPRMPS